MDTAHLLHWQQSRLGRRVLALEQLQLRTVMPEIFGRHMLQIGNWGRGVRLLASSRMLHCAVLGNCEDPTSQARIDLEQLPLMTHSVDSILLPHTLEFAASPHQLLRELDRVLTARGRLVVLGFNPWSLWGLREALGFHHRGYPAGGRLRSVGRLCDWLTLLDFEPVDVRRFGILLPGMSRFHRSPLLAAYMVVAHKRVIPLTGVRSPEKVRKSPAVGATVPVSRIRVGDL
ncbi:MAG: class I SAM-dependent methyltransferase [Sinobacteraceae bacterium]|nr:class I SAM-dependent methyltransferase [Nevskiaceae bacterium]